jgi:hypothetical protein
MSVSCSISKNKIHSFYETKKLAHPSNVNFFSQTEDGH